MISSRGLVVTLFAAALLAFLLPFGTVSCGEPVTFTGLELATATVQGDDADIVGEIEHYGSFFAFAAGISAVAGASLALAGRRGQGRAGLAGLVAIVLLPWSGWMQLAELTVHSGYVLATGSLAAVVAIRAALLLHELRAARRRIWSTVAGLCLLTVFLGLTAVLLLDASLSVAAS